MTIRFLLILFFVPLIILSQNKIDNKGFKQGFWKLTFPFKNDSTIAEEGFFLNDKEEVNGLNIMKMVKLEKL